MARRGRPPIRLTLDEEVRVELERWVRAFTSTQRQARRARIILACEQCGSAEAAARVVGVHPTTVERWRARFLKKGLRGLEDRARPGHKPKFTPVQCLEIIAAACEPVIPLAKKHKDEKPKGGKTTRTIAELVDEVQRRGIVSSIGWSTVQRLLADLDVKPHKTEQWLHSTDPEFREKVTAICDLYLTPPALNSVVLCIDEKPGMQALDVSRRWAATTMASASTVTTAAGSRCRFLGRSTTSLPPLSPRSLRTSNQWTFPARSAGQTTSG